MMELHHSQQFLTSLSRTFLPDVHLTTLDGEGRVVSGHKHILATVSNKLKSLFLKNEGEVGPIMVRNIGFQVLERVVDFIYGGNISVETVPDEEDVWDGLYMLRMVDGEMGDVYRTVDSQDGREIETGSCDPRKVLKKNVQVKIENISRNNVCIGVESSQDQIEEIDTSATAIEELQKPAGDYSESDLDILSSVELPLPKLYKCKDCSYSTAYKQNVKRHRQKLHLFGQLPELCGAEENNNRVTEEDKVPNEEMAKKITKKKAYFENKVECEVCEKKFRNRNSLACHKYNKHKEPKTVQEGVVCELCDRSYKNMYRLLIHQSKTHQQELEKRMCAIENLG